MIEHEFVDTYAILITTRDAPRDKALKFREELRRLLRALEDMHDFPHSFQTKSELGRREIDEQRRQKP